MSDSEPLTAEEEAGIRSGWWEHEARRGALAVGYVPRLLATLDAERAAHNTSLLIEGTAVAERDRLRAAARVSGDPQTGLREAVEALPFRRMTGAGLDKGGTTGDLMWDWDEWEDVVSKAEVLNLFAALASPPTPKEPSRE